MLRCNSFSIISMQVYIFNQRIPTYGFCIVIGTILSNLIALIIIKKKKLDLNDFILIEAFSLLGAFIGAKALYLFISFKYIEWNRLSDFNYLNQLMQGGFVFYGGLIGAFIAGFLACKFYKIKFSNYLNDLIFLVPLAHAFGRIGCFFSGCCYGVPYSGRFSVIFPENSFAPSGIQLFPVQLAEAIGLFIISITLVFIKLSKFNSCGVPLYFILYGLLRIQIEKYRFDSYRGFFLNLSTSQWLSIFFITFGLIMIYMQFHRRKVYG